MEKIIINGTYFGRGERYGKDKTHLTLTAEAINAYSSIEPCIIWEVYCEGLNCYLYILYKLGMVWELLTEAEVNSLLYDEFLNMNNVYIS